MRVRQENPFVEGYNSITEMGVKYNEMLMDFGILKLAVNQSHSEDLKMERAYVLVHGEVVFEWEDNIVSAKRKSCFHDNPWCLHVPSGVKVRITSLGDGAEVAILRTLNEKHFPPKLYCPEECTAEERGKGSLDDTSTRTVKLIFDSNISPKSNFVLGEVINYPGRWSSYPPHYHNQPEIYHYRFLPESGFGFAGVGNEAYKLKNNDTLVIPGGLSHPQTAAPGYAMYYLWVIRHLDGDPYSIPDIEEEHSWTIRSDAKIWPER